MDVNLPREVKPRATTRSEFDRMIELGFFEDEHVELLYGVIVTMTQGPRHTDLVNFLAGLLTIGLRGRGSVRVQSPVAASDLSEPEPDLAVVAPGRYRTAHPVKALWVIEVAESSLDKDRRIKARLYAEMGVPEYWIVNVDAGTIEVHSRPSRGHYKRLARYGSGKVVHPAAFPDVGVNVDELFE